MKIKIKFKLYLLVNLLKKKIKTSWIINSTPEYEIESIQQVALKLNGAAQYRVTTFDEISSLLVILEQLLVLMGMSTTFL